MAAGPRQVSRSPAVAASAGFRPSAPHACLLFSGEQPAEAPPSADGQPRTPPLLTQLRRLTEDKLDVEAELRRCQEAERDASENVRRYEACASHSPSAIIIIIDANVGRLRRDGFPRLCDTPPPPR